MALKKKGSKRRTISVDMEGVESGGKIVPDGNYPARLEEVKEGESKAENPMLNMKWRITGGKAKGALVYDHCSLTPQALWKLKGLLECLEIEVPDGQLDLDLSELEGAECTIEVTNETFENKKRPKVTNYGTVGEEDAGEEEEEDEEEEEEEDEPVKKPKKAKKAAKEEEEEEDAEEEEEEEEEDAGEEEEDDDDGEEEEEEEKPKKPAGKKTTGKTPKFKKGQKVSFKDEKGKTIRGVVLEIDGETVKVEDKGGDEWEIDISELTAL